MNTLEQFKIYLSYGKDGDGFSIFSREKEREIMNGFEWDEISRLLDDLYIVHNDLVSDEYKARIMDRLRDLRGSEELKAAILEHSKLPR